MIYAIDFDGTIHRGTNGPPPRGCIEVLRRLKECNHTIMIYSCRANADCVDDKESAIADMVHYLKLYNIPFDGILHEKPLFNYCIDDRNIGTPLTSEGFVDWIGIKELLK